MRRSCRLILGLLLSACSNESAKRALSSDPVPPETPKPVLSGLPELPRREASNSPARAPRRAVASSAPEPSAHPESEPSAHPESEPSSEAELPSLVLLSVQAAFSGTSRLFAERIPELLGAELGPRVQRVDLLVADERNDPPDRRALDRWRAGVGTGVEVRAVSADALPREFSGHAALPLVAIVDKRSGAVLRTIEGVWPLDVRDALERELARLDGKPEPEALSPTLYDGRFTEDTWELIQGMSLENLALAPDPTNAFADNERARRLGEELFFDAGFSSNGGVSCASCHQRERGFGSNDPRPPQGVGVARRKAPNVVFSRFAPTLFWDGRVDTLWGQATKPVEDPQEMNFTRVAVLRRLADVYRAEVEAIFGPLPSDEALLAFPERGMPGTPEWDGLSRAEQDAATRALVLYGKAVAAFERSLASAPLPLDDYAGGKLDALTDAQKDGLLAFLESGCPQCHFGPRLTDDAFHVLRAPTGSADLLPDPGRAAVLSELRNDPMRAAGRWSDAPDSAETSLPVPTLLHPGLIGAFRTPALRGVGSNPPYGHGGGDATLRKIVELHRTGGLPAGNRYTTGTAERWLAAFSEEARDRIVTFLESLPLVLR